MAQGGQAKMRISMASIALAVCAMIAAISFVAMAAAVDTGDLNKSEVQVCDNYKQNLAFALNSDILACHICCAKKHKSLKHLIKGSEVSADKCQCVIQPIRED